MKETYLAYQTRSTYLSVLKLSKVSKSRFGQPLQCLDQKLFI